MPKVAYSEEERVQIRQALVTTGLELMTRQGIQHTTVEQIYKAVGISRTFFYSFFPCFQGKFPNSSPGTGAGPMPDRPGGRPAGGGRHCNPDNRDSPAFPYPFPTG